MAENEAKAEETVESATSEKHETDATESSNTAIAVTQESSKSEDASTNNAEDTADTQVDAATTADTGVKTTESTDKEETPANTEDMPDARVDDVIVETVVTESEAPSAAYEPTRSDDIEIPVNKVSRRPFSFRLRRGRRYEDNNPRPVSVQSASRPQPHTTTLTSRRRDPISRFFCGLFSRDDQQVRDDMRPYEPEPEAWEPFPDADQPGPSTDPASPGPSGPPRGLATEFSFQTSAST